MKLLFTHRFYYPDTAPYALMLRSIARSFAKQGHDVHVFASKLSYRGGVRAHDDTADKGISVKRCWVFHENKRNIVTRVLNVGLYCTALFFTILRQRPDVVTVSTFPPVIAAWAASLAAKFVGAKLIYHMQDVHPEVSKYSGGRLGRGAAFRILRWLDNQTLKRAHTIIVLSEDMANTVRARGLDALNIAVINNFLLESFEENGAQSLQTAPTGEKQQIIFAGNFGRFQDLPLLTEGVALCLAKHPNLELLLLGNGSDETRLKALWEGHPQIRFSPFIPFAEAQAVIANADIGLVSIIENVYRVSYPSKMLTYLGLGVPVLALVEPESHLAQSIVSAQLGAVPAGRTPQAISEALEHLLEGLTTRDADNAAISDWVRANGSLEAALAGWQQIIEKASKV